MKECDLAFDEAGERISLSKRSVTHGCTSALCGRRCSFYRRLWILRLVREGRGSGVLLGSRCWITGARGSLIPPTTFVIAAGEHSPRSSEETVKRGSPQTSCRSIERRLFGRSLRLEVRRRFDIC